MEIRQLKAFVTVAKQHSFTRAAELLDYAQSSITAQVSALENKLNTKLFERLGRQVTLTQNGEKLLPYAEKILKLNSEAIELVSSSPVPRGSLSVGAMETSCIYRLPKLLQEYRKLFPNVDLTLVNGYPEELIHSLKENKIDVAFFTGQEITNPDLVSETLLDEPIVLVSAAGHPLSKKAPVITLDLQGETIVLCSCCYRATLRKIFENKGIQVGSILKFANIEVRKRCVINGLGITILPRVTVEAELNQGTLVDLGWNSSDFNIITQVAYHKDKWVSPVLRSFLELAHEIIVG
ncbi:transcriptional regulator, LysR family [Desulfofarcimen acetoxidans DSM 771]|uniref:Transcriptional regulator, LysR family n=1 Tax=Desulfofarcimen acetoxidans (strain ATCC 49208 / DSM 771 / KCTC 5769 / VKM B-1644 / 5575) TaxID=485916 RepID=C8W3M6_DESAS|nr:LysR family transcriptional regulator [Desulfofarcimen acetoxidans]ACV63812.1 transcriptional regulator, LysR family [Desulfofarcimen acetoxidans DSM 771]